MTSPTPTGLYDGFFGALRFADAFFALLAPFLAGALFFAAFFAMIGHPPRKSREHISFMAGPSGQAEIQIAEVRYLALAADYDGRGGGQSQGAASPPIAAEERYTLPE
jgi:hypothetical protein